MTRNQNGFSLIEAMISGALLISAIVGMNMMYVRQMKQGAAENLKLQARVTLNTIKSEILGNPGAFPVLFKNSQPVSYIACYDEKGLVTENAFGKKFYLARFVSDPMQSTDVCKAGIGGFEIHVTRPNSSETWVDLIILDSAGRQYKTGGNHFRSELTFESAL